MSLFSLAATRRALEDGLRLSEANEGGFTAAYAEIFRESLGFLSQAEIPRKHWKKVRRAVAIWRNKISPEV